MRKMNLIPLALMLVVLAILVYVSIPSAISSGSDTRSQPSKPCASPERNIQLEGDFFQRRLARLNLSPDGRYLLGDKDNEMLVWEVENGKMIHRYAGGPFPFFVSTGQLAMIRGGEVLFNQDGRWDEFYPVARLKGGTISPDGRYIAHVEFQPGEDFLNHTSYWISIYQIPGAQFVSKLAPLQDFVSKLAWSRDDQLFAVGTLNGQVTVWRVKDGQLIRTFEQGMQVVYHSTGAVTIEGASARHLVFSPDGTILASDSVDSILLWDISTGRQRKSFEFDWGIDDIAITPDGQALIAVGSKDFFIWDLKQEREICHDREEYERKMALSAHGKVLAVYEGSSRGRIAIYDVQELVQGKPRSSGVHE
jgi:hypothetical protein